MSSYKYTHEMVSLSLDLIRSFEALMQQRLSVIEAIKFIDGILSKSMFLVGKWIELNLPEFIESKIERDELLIIGYGLAKDTLTNKCNVKENLVFNPLFVYRK